MGRAADYTIQGFLYQFNKTLLEILKSSNDSEVTVEGIIEDIEVKAPSGVTAVQCKYHEGQTKFVPSLVFKPLLQMMHHFYNNPSAPVKYVLFAHFPPDGDNGVTAIEKAHLEAALQSKNQDLVKYTADLLGKVNLDQFLGKFTMEFGQSLDALVSDVCVALKQAGVPSGDIDTLAYPNALQTIVNLAIKHDPKERTITRAGLLSTIQDIKSTAITRWTLALKTRKQLLDAKRKQLKPNLDKNTRLRYFVINGDSLEDFDSDIVTFISDYLDKYHFKPTHINPPVFCLDTTDETFDDVRLRLYMRGIVPWDGYIGKHFDEARFFRAPMRQKDGNNKVEKEFSVRLLHWATNGPILNHHKCHDLFFLGSDAYTGLDTRDVKVEVLASPSLKEIQYMMGVHNVYEQDWASGLVRA